MVQQTQTYTGRPPKYRTESPKIWQVAERAKDSCKRKSRGASNED